MSENAILNPGRSGPDIPLEPYENRKPFNYLFPTNAELAPFIGAKWVVGKNTAKMRERHPNYNIVSPAKYKEAERQVIEARGYARLVEKVILDLIGLVGNLTEIGVHYGANIHRNPEQQDAVILAREILKKAREP